MLGAAIGLILRVSILSPMKAGTLTTLVGGVAKGGGWVGKGGGGVAKGGGGVAKGGVVDAGGGGDVEEAVVVVVGGDYPLYQGAL